MRGRLGLFLGFGAGYVLGAKAGRERYDQLQRLYDNLKRSPAVRTASGRARDVVETGFEQAKDKATEGVAKVQEVVRDRRSGTDGSTNLTVAPPISE